MSEPRDAQAGNLHAFAAAVAHEIRTPLSAIAGEVEIALRRHRPAAEYRDALERIAAGVAELVEISGDLTLLSDPPARAGVTAPQHLGTILARVGARYAGRNDVAIDAGSAADVTVSGDGLLLGRAITLAIEHALRHRKGAATVGLRAAVMSGGARLVIAAPPSGFWPRAWRALAEEVDDPAAPLRLRTARRILEAAGGALVLAPAPEPEMDAVHIELRHHA